MTETHFNSLILLSSFQSPGVTWNEYQKTNRREKKASWLRLGARGKTWLFCGILFASHPLEKNWEHQQSADAMGMGRRTGEVHCCYQKNRERGSRGKQYVLVISTGKTLQTLIQLQFYQNWVNRKSWLLLSHTGITYSSAHWAKTTEDQVRGEHVSLLDSNNLLDTMSWRPCGQLSLRRWSGISLPIHNLLLGRVRKRESHQLQRRSSFLPKEATWAVSQAITIRTMSTENWDSHWLSDNGEPFSLRDQRGSEQGWKSTESLRVKQHNTRNVQF